ncbi:RTA1 domain protein [Penicillium malachiteum]|nr:RTA1 domain protein [Penicillium malachiteum]
MHSPSIASRAGLASFDLYPYNPSKAAGLAFVVIFGIFAAIHFVYMFPLRAWSFIPFVVGCIGEAFGYYGRAWSHNNIRLGGPYLLQLMLILGCAPLLAATVCMTLGRFVRSLKST